MPPKEQAGLPLRHLGLDLSGLYPGHTLTTWMSDTSALLGEALSLVRMGSLPLVWPSAHRRLKGGTRMVSVHLLLVANSNGLETGGDPWVTLYLLYVAPVTLLIILWPPGLPERAPHLTSVRFRKIQRLMGGTGCSQKNLVSKSRGIGEFPAPGQADCLTCFWWCVLRECPFLWVLWCSEVFPRLCRLMLEAAMEATWILGTQDLITHARAPETPLVSTVPPRQPQRNRWGLRKDGTKDCGKGQSPMPMLKHQTPQTADN